MNAREQFLSVVEHGGKPLCSPQIGGGAGFDTRLAGMEWISQTTLEDTLAVLGRFGVVPLIVTWLDALGAGDHGLTWRTVGEKRTSDRVTTRYELATPVGTLYKTVVEEKRKGFFQTKYPVETADDLPALEYCLDAAIGSDVSAASDQVTDTVVRIAGRAALCVQWPVQPYELLCFPDGLNTVLLAEDCPCQFRRLMDKILILDRLLMREVAAGGADFVFLGAPGSELISPRYYEEFIIPGSIQVTSAAHEAGLKVYSHICSPVEPFLSMGFYNRMGIDLFETLSPPPVGNVASLAEARRRIDPSICTRGNLGLDVLLLADPATVRAKTREILDATAGFKHIVAASDYLFYDVPEANVQAMVEAVREYNKT